MLLENDGKNYHYHWGNGGSVHWSLLCNREYLLLQLALLSPGVSADAVCYHQRDHDLARCMWMSGGGRKGSCDVLWLLRSPYAEAYVTSDVSSHRMQAYSSVYTVESELRQELQKQEQAKQQKQDLESRIHDTELRIAKLQQKSQDSREVLYCHFQCENQLLFLF